MTLIEINELYNTNKAFKEYVEKYSRSHRMMPEDALKHKIVQEYAEYVRGKK